MPPIRRHPRLRWQRSVTAVAIAALIVAACGADSGSVQTDAPSSSPAPAPVDAVFAASPGAVLVEPDPAAPVDELVAGFNEAGFDLWRRIAPTDNWVFSPMSIGHAVLMARGAADEPTRGSIDAAFSLPDGQAAHDAWNNVAQAMTAAAAADDPEDEIRLAFADAVWPSISASPEQSWIDLLVTHHAAEVEPLDFSDQEASAARINEWTADQTEGLIQDLVSPAELKPATVLVLTDAVYFGAPWWEQFEEGEEPEPFTRLDGSTVDLIFMTSLKQRGPWVYGDGFVAQELLYRGGEFSMLVIVPDEGQFETVRSALGQPLLEQIETEFRDTTVEVWIPRWKTSTSFGFTDFLTEAGIAPGHYPGIGPGVFLGDANHAADIEVDQRGTVAAAATALMFLVSGPPTPTGVIRADRPFLYLLRHRQSGLVLFAGQVTDPTR